MIRIENYDIAARELCSLFDALHEAKSLNSISLPCYGFDDSCVISLCKLVNANESLKRVISNSRTRINGISIKGLERLVDNIIGNISLKELDLQVEIKNEMSCFELLKEIATKTGITKLNIPRHVISEAERQELLEYLGIPVEIREIPLASTSKSAAKSSRT